MDVKELEKLIQEGVKYIGFAKEPDKQVTVTIELLIEIRKYILTKSTEWYKEKFPRAYEFDMGETREKNDIYYYDDGIKYFFNDSMELEKVVLYGGNSEVKLETPINFSFHCAKKQSSEYCFYFYINEIDHFFTHCINNYLIKKGCSFAREKGIRYIKESIENADR